jgi:CBS domain-containing protein
MKASDVMVRDVITVLPETSVSDAAKVLLDRGISAVPVVDQDGRLVGIVSEGDLMRRAEIGTQRRRSWWLELLTPSETLAADFVKSHALKVAEVMNRQVITATEDMSLGAIATLLERHGIKRVPIVRDGSIVGIVSRANLLRAFANLPDQAKPPAPASDEAIRQGVLEHIRAQPGGMPWLVTVSVENGVVDLWGLVSSPEKKRAIRVAAEAMPGVREVRDNLFVRPLTVD